MRTAVVVIGCLLALVLMVAMADYFLAPSRYHHIVPTVRRSPMPP
jgi:hypothetical protein